MSRLFCLSAAAVASVVFAADWARFRGPNGGGVADGNPPVSFGPKSNVAWKAAPPAGKSSPVIVDGRLYLTGHSGESLITVAYKAATGRELWRRELKRRNAQKRHKLNDPAAPTAAADGRRVVVFFTEFGLACYSPEGKEQWTLPLDAMASMQGVSASPVLHGDTVYLVVDQARDSFVLAVNAANGEQRWRKARPDSPGGVYSSPVLFEGGPEPVLGVLGDIEFSAYSLKTGERVWWVSGLPSQAKTSPAVAGDRIVLSVNAMAEEAQIPVFAAVLAADANGNGKLDFDEAKGVPRAVFPTVDRNRDNQVDEGEWAEFRVQALQPSATLSIRPRGRGDLTKTAVEWRAQRAVPNVPSPLVANGLVYTVRNGGVAGIYDAGTGEVKKEFRLPGALGDYYASPVAAGRYVYFASMEGKITVLEAGAEGRVAQTVAMEEEIFATPAIVGDALYVRTQQGLYCFRQTVQVRRGEKEGTMQLAVPLAWIPLERTGQDWAATLEVVYRVMGPDGQERDRAAEAVQIRVEDGRKREMMGQSLRLTRPLANDAEAAELLVEVTARPAGVTGSGRLSLEPAYRVSTEEVLIPFLLRHGEGKMVADLRAGEIRVVEDGEPRTAALTAARRLPVESIPVEVTLLYDCSGSVQAGGRFDPFRLRKGMLEEYPNVRIAIYGFSDILREFTPHTRDEAALERAGAALLSVAPRSTPLFTSIAETIRRFDRRRQALRLLVVFSDGETFKRIDQESYGTVMKEAREAGVAIYPVYTGPPMVFGARPARARRPSSDGGAAAMAGVVYQMDASTSAADFMRLAQSGGQGFTKISGADVLPKILGTTMATVRQGYVASYRPRPGARMARVELQDARRGQIVGGIRELGGVRK